MGRGADQLLYGDGVVVKHRGESNLKPLTDEDYLKQVDQLPARIPYRGKPFTKGLITMVADSALHTASPTEKEYRGHIGVEEADDGTRKFVGITAFGKAGNCGAQGKKVYEGPSIAAACAKVNEMLQKKRKGRSSSSSYVPLSGTGPENLSRQDVISTFSNT